MDNLKNTVIIRAGLTIPSWGAHGAKMVQKKAANPPFQRICGFSAQMERFELSHRLSQSTPLAGERWHSKIKVYTLEDSHRVVVCCFFRSLTIQKPARGQAVFILCSTRCMQPFCPRLHPCRPSRPLPCRRKIRHCLRRVFLPPRSNPSTSCL